MAHENMDYPIDETDYLLSSPANRERLLKAIEHVNQNRELVTIDPDQFPIPPGLIAPQTEC